MNSYFIWQGIVNNFFLLNKIIKTIVVDKIIENSRCDYDHLLFGGQNAHKNLKLSKNLWFLYEFEENQSIYFDA